MKISKNRKFKRLAIAGTFDRLHKGHRFFISQAFKIGQEVVIGLTSDLFVKNKFQPGNGGVKSRIQLPIVKPFKERKSELLAFLREKGWSERADIVEIDDVYGPSLKESDIEALIVTAETKEGGEKVNRKRKTLGLPPLKIVEVPFIEAEDKERISSTRIRLGEIDRWGKVFSRLAIFGGKIPQSLRLSLKKPLGELIEGERERIEEKVTKIISRLSPVVVVAVGDEATLCLNKLNILADISIVDFFIKRVRVHEELEDLDFPAAFLEKKYKGKIAEVVNPAGNITKELVKAIKQVLELYVSDGKKRVIIVTGEEDLAGIPAILLSPLGSLVFYGQPNKGIVAVEVTEEKKNQILKLVTFLDKG